MRRGRISGLLLGCTMITGFASCGDDDQLRILAASSLTDAFEEAGALHQYEEVDFIFAGSPRLVAQLESGAGGDLLVTADERTMAVAVERGLVGDPATIATNHLVLAVAPDNPANISDLSDLGDPTRVIGICAPEVPCGALALAALGDAGVEVAADTEEPNVRSLAGKIALGEVDAGLIYRTDAIALDLDTVAVGGLTDHATRYQAAVVGNSVGGSALQRALLGASAQAVLRSLGFGEP